MHRKNRVKSSEKNGTCVRCGQHGGARLRLLVFLLIFGTLAYVGWKTIPPYVAEYELEDWMRTQTPYFLVNHMPDDTLRDAIMKELQDRDIPAGKDDVKIQSNNARMIKYEVDYSVPLDFGFYQTALHFSAKSDSQSLIQ